jgi:hypothetical protein
MSSIPDITSTIGRAEKAFRDAFERLKQGKPDLLPMETSVSQNNVAKEAGCDPSALKKSRYPSLIAEIQRWIQEHGENKPPSPRQTVLAQRSRNRSLREKIEALKAQRDNALSLLGEADSRILDLTMENARLQALRPASNVTALRNPKGTS